MVNADTLKMDLGSGFTVGRDTHWVEPEPKIKPYTLLPPQQQKTSNPLVSYYTWAKCTQCNLTARHKISNPDDCSVKAFYTCMWNDCGNTWGMSKEFYTLWGSCAIQPGDDSMIYVK